MKLFTSIFYTHINEYFLQEWFFHVSFSKFGIGKNINVLVKHYSLASTISKSFAALDEVVLLLVQKKFYV